MSTIRIVHCSDPHFGSPNQETAWASFRDDVNLNVKPHLVLITGDLVHTTHESYYKDAAKELASLQAIGRPPNDSYRVCAGNHDRHPFGNAPGPFSTVWKTVAGWNGVPAWFDQAFAGRIPTVAQPSDIDLSDEQNQWTVRIIGIDTSTNAKYTAQGYALQSDIESLAAVAAYKPADLVLVMHHHHLLSIPELEEQRQALVQVLRPTIMLNAGKILEALARAHVNVVLHGHEHHRAASRYGTLRGKQTETVVLGAGSATGNDSTKGCDVRRASYNVIELRQDKSVYVQERAHDATGWSSKGSPVQLFDSRAIRRARFHRRAGPGSPPTSKITKCVEFHSDRSIDVYQSWTNWELSDGPRGILASNSSGLPQEAQVKFDWQDANSTEYEDIRCFPHSAADTYRLEVGARGEKLRRAKQISLRFRWVGGAVLTQGDLEFLDPTRRGVFRSTGREYSAFRVVNELQSLSLLIRIPALFAPRPEEVEVLFAEQGAEYEVSTDLRTGLQHHAPGLFSLEIPYPFPKFRYALAWPLKEGPCVSVAAKRFHDVACRDECGAELLKAFADSVRMHAAVESATLGLYVPGAHSTALQRAAELRAGDADDQRTPDFLALNGDNFLNRHAWWGQIQRAVADPGRHNPAFMQGERALIIVPIRQFGRENEVTWGLIRLGIHAGQGGETDALLLNLLAQTEMLEALAGGVLSVLQRGSQLG